jgi:hypothetical protein
LGLYRTLRRECFNIVHPHNPQGGLLGPLTGQLARTSLVVHTVHGFPSNENSSPGSTVCWLWGPNSGLLSGAIASSYRVPRTTITHATTVSKLRSGCI